MRTKELLSRATITDLFTTVFVLVDDYLQEAQRQKRLSLPSKRHQKASYSEIMTIVIMGEIPRIRYRNNLHILPHSFAKTALPTLFFQAAVNKTK